MMKVIEHNTEALRAALAETAAEIARIVKQSEATAKAWRQEMAALALSAETMQRQAVEMVATYIRDAHAARARFASIGAELRQMSIRQAEAVQQAVADIALMTEAERAELLNACEAAKLDPDTTYAPAVM
jgi:prephenate dehydratase